MSKETPRLPSTPKCSSPVRIKTTESDSSRNSESPIHWRTLIESDSPKVTKIRPSSWDNSDDELPVTLEGVNARGHIYSSASLSNRKSVTAEINELKKQFFQAAILETETEIEDLREQLELSLKNDRRQSPARVRRRTKSWSSSSTVMDVTIQNSPKREEELIPQFDTIFDNVENIAPLLELDSKFYLDNFFAELRHKRISVLESTVGIANERDKEDFQEVALENSDDFVNKSDGGYYNRTSRKLSQILEVEENKKDSDKDVEECSENTDLFSKFSAKSEDNDFSPLHTARGQKEEKLFENVKKNEHKFKSSSAELENIKRVQYAQECLSERQPTAIQGEMGNKIISLTAKTGTISLNSPKWEIVKQNNTDLDETRDDEDVNWNLIENLKLDLIRSSEDPNSRKSSERERNSGSESKRSARNNLLQSPKFIINLEKDSARSLKAEEIKTPNSLGKNSIAESDRSLKDRKNSCGSAVQEADKNFLDLKSPSLGSRTSNRSLELQDILMDRRANTNSNTRRSKNTNDARNQAETLNGSELSYRSKDSECSSRSVNSRSSRSSRSYRLSSRANESRTSFQKSEKLKLTERTESRRSSSVSSRTELELLKLSSRPQSEKSCYRKSRNKESMKSTPRGMQIATPETSSNRTDDILADSKNFQESFNNETIIADICTGEWIDIEKIQTIPSNRSENLLKSQASSSSSRSEIIVSENLDKPTRDDSVEEPEQSKNRERKSPIVEHLENLDNISSSRSTKNKSRPDSCVSDERTNILNISLEAEKSEEIKINRRTTDRSGIIEESEDKAVQKLNNDSESDRKLSVINEPSFEKTTPDEIAENPKNPKRSEIEGSEEADRGQKSKSRPSKDQSPKESLTKPEELWKDLIQTFSEDQNQPFNWQDNFLGFLHTNPNSSMSSGKEVSPPAAENTKFFGEKEDDFISSKRLTENTFRSPRRSEKDSSPKKRLEKKDFPRNLDLDVEDSLSEKMKNDDDAQNLYYFRIEKRGNFGIGEFGDVTCWNLGVSHALEEGKPKGGGDGMLSRYHMESPILNRDNTKIPKQVRTSFKSHVNSTSKVQKSFLTNDEFNLTPFLRNDFKPSKSDTCINLVDFSHEINKLASEQNISVFENQGKRKRKAASSISSVRYSTSDCLSDETDNQDSEFESVRRSASLTDIPAQLRRSGREKLESNESLYNSGIRLYEKMRKEAQDKDSTNLNIYLSRKRQEDKAATKSNWFLFTQSRGKTCRRENKKYRSRLKIDKSLIKKDSKEYLSFRSRHSIPVLKLRGSNCFQNFYKRVISVFCLTSDSSLPTTK